MQGSCSYVNVRKCNYFLSLITVQDRHAIGRFLPPIDESQDWTLISGEEQNGRTIIEFSRPFLSCDDENDMDITVSANSLLSDLYNN